MIKSEESRRVLNAILAVPGGGRVWEYWLPFPFKTGNSSTKGHWAKRARESKKAIEAMGLVVLGAGKPSKPLEKARLYVHRISYHAGDGDNLGTGFKHYRDGLIHAGVLKDDRPSILLSSEYTGEARRDKSLFGAWVWVLEVNG